jgi:hypothetical protein
VLGFFRSGDIDLQEFHEMQKNSLELHSIQEYLRRRSSTLHLASIDESESEDGQSALSDMLVSDAGGGVADIASHWQVHLVRTLEALDNGVRLDRSNSTNDNPKMQGDVKMLGELPVLESAYL